MNSEIDLKLQEISNTVDSTSVAHSRKDFNNFVKSFVGNNQTDADPNNLNETIKTYTDRFDRLKFLFLEQEAKERFMRLVLEQETKIIDRGEIQKSMEELEDLKKVLEEKKVRIADVTEDITTSAHEIHEMRASLMSREARIETLVKKTEDTLKELSRLQEVITQKSSQDPSKAKVLLFQQNNPSLGYDIESLSKEEIMQKIKEISSKRAKLSAEVSSAQKEKDQQIEYITRNAQRSKQLITENQKLDELIANIRKVQGDQTPSEESRRLLQREKSLRVLIELWMKITDIEQFKYDEKKVIFKLKGHHDEINIGLEGEQVSSLQIEGIDSSTLTEIVVKANESQDPTASLMNSIRSLLQ